jgi:hypothetical protein
MNRIFQHIGIFAFVITGQAAQAGEAYTWTDEDGTTHFSEAPPGDPVHSAETVELLPPTETKPTGDDYYSVINQANRMQQRRLESERLEAERKQAEAEAMKARAEAEALRDMPQQDHTPAEPRYYPGYPLYGYRPAYGYYLPGHRYRGLRPPRHKHSHRPGRPGHLPAHPGGGHRGPERRPASVVVGNR